MLTCWHLKKQNKKTPQLQQGLVTVVLQLVSSVVEGVLVQTLQPLQSDRILQFKSVPSDPSDYSSLLLYTCSVPITQTKLGWQRRFAFNLTVLHLEEDMYLITVCEIPLFI